jgi:hypothetical protein
MVVVVIGGRVGYGGVGVGEGRGGIIEMVLLLDDA